MSKVCYTGIVRKSMVIERMPNIMQDLRQLTWDANPRNTQGTAGTFLKAFDGKYYYKLSAGDYLSGFYGHEAVNEVIVSRLLDLLGIEHTKYTGCKALIQVANRQFETYVRKSLNYRHTDESKLTLETFYALYGRANENILEFLARMGFTDNVDKLLLVDFLIINRDRHGANVEVLQSNNKFRLAPIFDNGVSFVAPMQNQLETIKGFEPMRDVVCNNFLGTYSVIQNLRYISKPVRVNKLNFTDLSSLFYGTGTSISDVHKMKILQIIQERYDYARNQKILREE